MFALVGTGLAAVVFLGLTLDSHRRFDDLTNAENITPEVIHGKDVWHKYNCINCHTLFKSAQDYHDEIQHKESAAKELSFPQ